MREIIPQIVALLTVARAAGIMVVHLRTAFHSQMTDAGRPGSRTRQMMLGLGSENENVLLETAPGVAIVPDLTPSAADVIVTKTRFSGFARTNLEHILRSREIESVILVGGTTTVCVESTVRDGLFLEFNPLVLSDCTADINSELHESALRRIDQFFGWVCKAQDLMPALQAATKRALAV